MGDKENEEIRNKAIYISGPMTGYDKWNFPAFNRCDEYLKNTVGCTKVFNPANFPVQSNNWKECIKFDMQLILDEDIEAVVLLDGWRKSKGANLEVHMATSLGAVLYEYHEGEVCTLSGPYINLPYNGEINYLSDEEFDKMEKYSLEHDV